MSPLALYDVVSKLPGNTWSPTTKTRYVLSYKNPPFEAVWLEFPDIAAKCKEIGTSPNKRRDGSELYTVPVLSDPNTGALITDSPALLTTSTRPIQKSPSFLTAPKASLLPLNPHWKDRREALKFIILGSSQIQTERGQEHVLTTRQAFFGEKADEWSPKGPKHDAHWETILFRFGVDVV